MAIKCPKRVQKGLRSFGGGGLEIKQMHVKPHVFLTSGGCPRVRWEGGNLSARSAWGGLGSILKNKITVSFEIDNEQ